LTLVQLPSSVNKPVLKNLNKDTPNGEELLKSKHSKNEVVVPYEEEEEE
jgi:hypothetical protein